jgi:hypothetical protein
MLPRRHHGAVGSSVVIKLRPGHGCLRVFSEDIGRSVVADGRGGHAHRRRCRRRG